MRWAYGVTTVPSRIDTLLPNTLNSLANAGFDSPRIFMDGDYVGSSRLSSKVVSKRVPAIKAYGNWLLGLLELVIREPIADRYALFQDDFVTCRGLREYLERCLYPDKGYLNLYTFPSNQSICPEGKVGWYKSNQFGRGAVALVFDREAALTLLSNRVNILERPASSEVGPDGTRRAECNIDGAVVTALVKAGFTEYVHNPSLVQHTGMVSAIGHRPHKQAESFRGEDYNVLELLAK